MHGAVDVAHVQARARFVGMICHLLDPVLVNLFLFDGGKTA